MRNGYLNVYVENLDKKAEGIHLGRWIDLPQPHEDLIAALASIEAKNPLDASGYLISDCKTSFGNLTDYIGRHTNIVELNEMAAELDRLSPEETNKFCGVLACGGEFETSELIALTRNLDKYNFYEELSDAHTLGVFVCSKEIGIDLISDELMNHIDYEGYGKAIAEKRNAEFTPYGYISRKDSQPMQYHADINFITPKTEEPFNYFRAQIRNKNNLTAVYIDFPTAKESIAKQLNTIGLSLDRPQDFYINKGQSDFSNLPKCVKEDANLLQLNCLCDCLKQTDDLIEREVFEAVAEENFNMGLPYLIDVTHNFECFDLYPDVKNATDLGVYLVYEANEYDIPESDEGSAFEEIGTEYMERTKGDFTSNGYLFSTDRSFIPAYEMIPNMPPRSQNTQPQAEREAILSVNVMSTVIKYYGTPTTDNKNIYLHMPMTQEELSSSFAQIGADYDNYDSYMYNRYKTSIPALDPHIGNLFSYMPEANYLAECISNLNESDREKFEAIIGAQSELTAAKAVNFALEMDCYAPFPDIKNLEDLGKRLVNDGVREAPTENPTEQDYKEIGAEYQAQRGGYITSMGFIKQTDYPTEQSYSGPENIPKQDNAGPTMKMI